MKRRLVYIVESFGGGVLTFLRELTQGLIGDFEIIILYGRRAQTPENVAELFSSQVQLIEIKDFQRSLNLIADSRAYWRLYQLVKTLQPDVVHLNSSKAGFLGRLLPFKSQAKIFYTPHGYSFLNSPGSKQQLSLYFWAEKLLGYRKRVQTVTVSLSEYQQAKKVTKNVQCINNGIDVQAIDLIKPTSLPYQQAVVTVGRISEQKNPQLFNQLAQEFPKQKFLWLGDGPLRSQLTAPNIQVLGWLAHEQVLAILKQTSIFVLLSKWEGLSLALLEAMYCQNSCLVSQIASNQAVIQDHQNGLVVANLPQAVTALSELLEQPNLYGTAAKKSVLQNYDVQQMVKKYHQLYNA